MRSGSGAVGSKAVQLSTGTKTLVKDLDSATVSDLTNQHDDALADETQTHPQ